MSTLSLDDAQARLREVVAGLQPGEEVILTHDDKPVATIKATPPDVPRPVPRFGTMKGTILYIAPDFDAIPEGFEEYL